MGPAFSEPPGYGARLDEFGMFMIGRKWDREDALLFMIAFDTNDDGTLDFDEFSVFCEECLVKRVVSDMRDSEVDA